jgi:hypothetical protein
VTEKSASEQLRAPFPKDTVGKLPKGGVMLDFVGHAAVTDRLLTVDPAWTWEPLAIDERGLPALDKEGNLWIRLTIDGVTRLGVGDGRTAKERIGDALRNAAMRFGVALSLWTKDELESGVVEHREQAKPARQTAPKPSPEPAVAEARTEQQSRRLFALLHEVGLSDRDETLAYVGGLIGRELGSTKELTKAEASRVIDTLAGLAKAGADSDGVVPVTA